MNEQLIPDLAPLASESDVLPHDLPLESGGEDSITTKQGAVPKEPLVSLSRILFSAVDICVYCGGKFVG